MQPAPRDDPRAEQIETLADWAGLARYWMGHDYRPALEKAVGLVKERGKRDRRWKRLADYLESVLRDPHGKHPETPSPSDLARMGLSKVERQTLQLVELIPLVVGCEQASQALASLPEQVVTNVLQQIGIACAMAAEVGDLPIEARGCHALAQGFEVLESGRTGPVSAGPLGLEFRLRAAAEVRRGHARAQECYERLAARQPAIYRPALVLTLAASSLFLYRQGDRNGAQRTFARALELFDELGQADRETQGLALVGTLVKLALAQKTVGAPESARTSLERSLGLCRSLAANDPHTFRAYLAQVLDRLAALLREMGEPAPACEYFREAVELYRTLPEEERRNSRPDFTRIVHELGALLLDLGNPREARSYLEEAAPLARLLVTRQPEVYRPGLASTLRCLAHARAFTGDRTGAAEAFQEAAATYRSLGDRFLPDVATSLADLGTTQSTLGDPQAVPTLEEAVGILSRLSNSRPELGTTLGRTLCSLGMAQLDVWAPEAARRNLEAGVARLRLAAPDRGSEPDLAEALVFLGRAHHALGDTPAAVGHVGEAIQISREIVARTPPGVQGDRVRHNLGLAYQTLGGFEAMLHLLHEASGSLAAAIAELRPLADRAPDLSAPALARACFTAGRIHYFLGNLDEAEARFEEAKAIWEPLAGQRPDIIWPALAEATHALGVLRLKPSVALAALPHITASTTVVGDVRMQGLNNLRQAIALFDRADAHCPTAHLEPRMRCWLSLGEVLQDGLADGRADLHGARDALHQAAVCAEALRGGLVDRRQRRRIQSGVLEVYRRLFETCVRIGEQEGDETLLEEAVEVGEAIRARNLMELLADEELRPANTPPELVEELRARRRDLRQAQQAVLEEETPGQLGAAAPGTEMPGTLLGLDVQPRPPQRLHRLRQEAERHGDACHAVLARIRAEYDPGFDPDQPVRPIPYREVRELLAGPPTALVQYTLAGEHGVALVITVDGVAVVALPGLGAQESRDLASRWYEARLEPHEGPEPFEQERATLQGLLEVIGERAVRPVLDALSRRELERVVLVPNREMHLFPLHACPVEGRSLTDRYDEVSYAPSLSILCQCAHRRREGRDRLTLVVVPAGDLPFAELEGSAVSRLYTNPSLLTGADATKERFVQQVPASQVLHFAGHATFDSLEPLRSGLILFHAGARGDELTLRELFSDVRLPDNQLAVISGCESGRVKPDQVDEYIGLPSGFLYAGSNCVVSSLWPVEDLSTALLMGRFHMGWRAGRSAAAALGEAQRWLRDQVTVAMAAREAERMSASSARVDEATQALLIRLIRHLKAREKRAAAERLFAHPYYWAAFTVVGL